MRENITKTEAVKRALAALGNDAMPVAIQGWVKDKLDIEMKTGHISTTKGELLRKAAKKKPASAKPASVEPMDASEPKVTISSGLSLPAIDAPSLAWFHQTS